MGGHRTSINIAQISVSGRVDKAFIQLKQQTRVRIPVGLNQILEKLVFTALLLCV